MGWGIVFVGGYGIRDVRRGLLIWLGSLVTLRVIAGVISKSRNGERIGGVTCYAHRGGSKNAPENTIAAFERGIQDGANGLEMDVHLSVDGNLVVIHDPEVERTTDGCGRVCRMDIREIKLLDAGYRFGEGGDRPYRGKGLGIPAFHEVLGRFPNSLINVEIKADEPEAIEMLLKTLQNCDAADRTVVASVSHRKMLRLRRSARRFVREGRIDRLDTSASLFEISVFHLASLFGFEAFVPISYVALQIPVEYRGIRITTPRFIKAAHSRGVRVDVWTVDDADEMRRLARLGVDGIMTDRPDVLASVLRERRAAERCASAIDEAKR